MKINANNNFWSIFWIIILIGLIAVVASSCRIKKDVSKTEETVKTEVLATTTATSITQTTGTLEVKPDSILTFHSLDNLLTGDTSITEDENFITTVLLDKKTKTVKTKTVQKAKSIPVNITNTTVTKGTVHTKQESEKHEKNKKVETIPFYMEWWFWLIIIVVGAVVWIVKRLTT